MPAPVLLPIFDAAYLLAMSAWVGGSLFFSFGVAPILFKVLGAEPAARFVRALFPRYYAWGATCGAIALPAAMGAPLTFPEYRGPWVGVQALLILAGTLVMLYCGQSLTPALNAARDAGPAGQARFARLHRRGVLLNGVVLAIGVGLLIAFAARRAPRQPPVFELGPAGRAREIDRLMRDGAPESRPRAPAAHPRGP